jgi:DNA-binding YbaB/EbfC family protein
MAQLMQQAQKMQENLKRAQEEIAQLEVTGSAGGGMVSVTMSGRHEVRRVAIDRKILADDPEMAEDLVVAAFNDAVNKVAAASQERMAGLAGGMDLPPGFKLPF